MARRRRHPAPAAPPEIPRRAPRTVRIGGKGADSARHTISFEVPPDYLAIGSNQDFHLRYDR